MFVVKHSCFCLCLNDRYYPPDYDPSQESLNKGDENYTSVLVILDLDKEMRVETYILDFAIGDILSIKYKNRK